MIDAIFHLLVLKNASGLSEPEAKHLEFWFQEPENNERLKKETHKVLDHFIEDSNYQVERAFSIIAQRLVNEVRRAVV